MPIRKVTSKEVTMDELRVTKLPGISNQHYEVEISVPKTWLVDPVKGIGITAAHVSQVNLKNLAFYSAGTSIKSVSKTRSIIAFEVAGPYVQRFHEALRAVPEDAEIRIREDNK